MAEGTNVSLERVSEPQSTVLLKETGEAGVSNKSHLNQECDPTHTETKKHRNSDIKAVGSLGPFKRSLHAQDRAALLRQDIRGLDSMITKMSHEKNLAAEIFMAAEIESDDEIKLQSHARALMGMAKAHIERRKKYLNLFGILIFFTLYCVAIMLQRDGSAAYDVESR